MVGAADLLGHLFNVLVRGLRLLGEDDVDVVVLEHFPGVSLHFVAVEHQDHPALFKALIVAENILQADAGGIQVGLRQTFELRPGKYDIVSVYQQIIFHVVIHDPLP